MADPDITIDILEGIRGELRDFRSSFEQRLGGVEQRLGGVEQRLGGVAQRL